MSDDRCLYINWSLGKMLGVVASPSLQSLHLRIFSL